MSSFIGSNWERVLEPREVPSHDDLHVIAYSNDRGADETLYQHRETRVLYVNRFWSDRFSGSGSIWFVFRPFAANE